MLAEAAIIGLPVGRFIHSRDPVERDLLEAARVAGQKLLDDLMTNLARKIVKETADAQNRGAKKAKTTK